jgi:hypothetical protein
MVERQRDRATGHVTGQVGMSDDGLPIFACQNCGWSRVGGRPRYWESSCPPGAHNGYRGARYLRDTPFASVREWRRAMIDAIPDEEKCGICKGDGRTVILASNGGVSETPTCWACQGSGSKRPGGRVHT